MSAPKSRLTYEDFLAVFEEGRKDNYAPKEEDAPYAAMKFEKLSPEAAGNKLKAKVRTQVEVLQKVSIFYILH